MVELDIARVMASQEGQAYQLICEAMVSKMGDEAADEAIIRGVVLHSKCNDGRRLVQYVANEYRRWAVEDHDRTIWG